jgi:hypothetical protein
LILRQKCVLGYFPIIRMRQESLCAKSKVVCTVCTVCTVHVQLNKYNPQVNAFSTVTSFFMNKK